MSGESTFSHVLFLWEILREITGENRRTTYNKKIGSNIFIVDKFCKKFTCKIRDFKIMKHVYM
jgi:hypothetical protein